MFLYVRNDTNLLNPSIAHSSCMLHRLKIYCTKDLCCLNLN